MPDLPKKIIAIQPVDDVMRIGWRIDIRCNYSCCYCHKTWHSDNSKVNGLEDFQSRWLKIWNMVSPRKKKLKLSFIGGELTVNKNFLPFIEWLYDNYGKHIQHAGFTTNGSAPAWVYERLLAKLDWIDFSIHSEFFNERKFFETVAKVKETAAPGKQINVTIMDESWNQDRFEHYRKFLDDRNIYWKMGSINWKFAHRSTPVTNTKIEWYPFDVDNKTS